MKKRKQSAGGRLAVMTVDQVISGASNVLIAILAARLLSAADFGLFGIVFLVYVILIGVTRALVSDPLLVHPVESRSRAGEAIGTGILLTLPLAIGLAAAGLGIRMWDPSLGDALIVLAACLPFLVMQDVGRYLGFATQRATRAVILDTVWLLAMFALVGVLLTRHGRTLASFIAAWGGSGAVAGVLLFAWYDFRRVRFGLAWLKQTWGLAWRYLVWYTSMQGSALGMSAEVGAIAGARSLGGVQATVLLVRPFTTFQVAAATAGIGEIARAAGHKMRIWRHALGVGAVTGAAAAVNMVVMLVLPNDIGKALLGASWHPAQPLLLPAGLQIVFIGLATGPTAALLGIRAMNTVMGVNIAGMILVLAGAAIGAVLDGARGALWLVTASRVILMLASWAALTVRMRRVVPAAGERGGAAEPTANAASAAPLPADVVPSA